MDAREFGGGLAWKDRAREALATSRHRLLDLLRPVPPEVLTAQHTPLMSPPVWDLAHVANYEEQWLLRALGEAGLSDAETDRLYDAFRNPRQTRGELPLLGLQEAFGYAEQVRDRVLRMLDRVDEDAVRRIGQLLDGGFVYGMVAQHEQQHIETLRRDAAARHLDRAHAASFRRHPRRAAPCASARGSHSGGRLRDGE